MSDDKPSRAEQHLINEARKHQAHQPQPPDKVTIGRVGRFNGMTSNVHWLTQAWSPDGKQLAFGGAMHDGHGRLHAWHGDSGHDESFTVRHLTHDVAGAVSWLAWAPDSKHLASVERAQASGEPVVRIRSQAEGVRPVQLPPGLPVEQAVWSPDGGTLAVSGPDRPETVLIDAASGRRAGSLDHLAGPVAWQPGGQLIAGIFETSVLLCDPATGGTVGRLAGQEHHPAALAWDRRGKHLAVADGERIIVWDAEAGTQRWRSALGDRGGRPGSRRHGHQHPVARRRRLPDGVPPRGGAWRDEQGSTVATGIVWDIETGEVAAAKFFDEHEQGRRQPVAGIAASPDGRRIAVAADFIPPVIWKIVGDLPHLSRPGVRRDAPGARGGGRRHHDRRRVPDGGQLPGGHRLRGRRRAGTAAPGSSSACGCPRERSAADSAGWRARVRGTRPRSASRLAATPPPGTPPTPSRSAMRGTAPRGRRPGLTTDAITWQAAVSCLSATSCLSVGNARSPEGGYQSATAYGWNGAAWTRQNPSVPPANQANAFNGVSCVPGSFCMVVGGAESSPALLSYQVGRQELAAADRGRTGGHRLTGPGQRVLRLGDELRRGGQRRQRFRRLRRGVERRHLVGYPADRVARWQHKPARHQRVVCVAGLLRGGRRHRQEPGEHRRRHRPRRGLAVERREVDGHGGRRAGHRQGQPVQRRHLPAARRSAWRSARATSTTRRRRRPS